MAATIQICNVPDDLHRRLKSRAVFAGMPLSDYLLGEFTRIEGRSTLENMRTRLQRRSRVSVSVPPEDVVPAARGR